MLGVGEFGDVFWVHPEEIPEMTVEIFKSPTDHHSVIFEVVDLFAASSECFGGDGFYFIFCFTCKRKNGFGGVLVSDWGFDESLEFFVDREHHKSFVVDDHACRFIVGEVGVELEPELAEESLGFLEVFDWEIDEYRCEHEASLEKF